MCEYDLSSPHSYRFEDFRGDFFEFWIFYLVVACELFDDEEAICSEFDRGRSEFDRTSDAEEGSRVFCDIIGRMTDIFVLLLDDTPILRRQKNPAPRRTRISSGSSICIDDKFIVFFCHTPKEYLFENSRQEEILVQRMTKNYTNSSNLRKWGVR